MEKWRRAWREGGAEALRSKGPMCVKLLSPVQWERLVRELERGTLAHGWDEEQGWTLVRIWALIIRRLFGVKYTVQGVWKLMRRHGWSPQVPARRALERDDASVERWRSEVWETVKPPRRPGTQISTSTSPTSSHCSSWRTRSG